jgi:hypothetical protein
MSSSMSASSIALLSRNLRADMVLDCIQNAYVACVAVEVRSSPRALTGTPVENRLADLWSLFEFLNPGLLGSAAVFRDQTAREPNGAPEDTMPLLFTAPTRTLRIVTH